MKIEDIKFVKGGVFFDVVGSKGRKYVVYVDKNCSYCTCPNFVFRKKECKHIKECKKVADMVLSWEDIENSQVVREFPSSLKVINEMFGGFAYSSDNLFGIFGLGGEGKSLLCIQDAFYLVSQGYKVLYIDTEGSVVSQLRRYWGDVFANRFNVSKSDLKERFFIENFRGKVFSSKSEKIEKLLYYFGDDIEIEKKGNKIEIKWVEKKGKKSSDLSLIEKDISDLGIDFVILDSLTNPIRIAVSSNPQNFPAKSDLEARILGHLLDLQAEYNIGCIVTMQATYNPTNPYDNQIHIRGGLSALYNIKRRMAITSRKKDGVKNYRIFWFERGEVGSSKSRVGFAKITDIGYVDVDLEKEGLKMKDLLTDSQLKKLKSMVEDE